MGIWDIQSVHDQRKACNRQNIVSKKLPHFQPLKIIGQLRDLYFI